MAEIQIKYRYYVCDLVGFEASRECLSECAEHTGCIGFEDGGIQRDEELGCVKIPYGDCIHSNWEYGYKGWVGKQYEMEEYNDVYSPHMNCMRVKLGKKEYDCVKVTLNGECIYNKDDETSESS